MSEEKQGRIVRFVSEHANMTIMRKPVETTRSVNGVMQIVKEDQVPFKFSSGNLSVSEEEAKEIRKKRGYGTLYEELPPAVENVAKKGQKSDSDQDPDGADADLGGEIKTTVVEEVENFNQAANYLKDNFGLEHKDVMSKNKVFEQANRLAIEFPNFTEEVEE